MTEFKIINERDNPLFNRKEIEGIMKADKTPSYSDVMNLIADKYSVKLETIKVKEIKGKFGIREFNVKVNIYDSEEDKKKIEFFSKKDKLREDVALNPPKPEVTEEKKEEPKAEGNKVEEGFEDEGGDKGENKEESKEKTKAEEVKKEIKEDSGEEKKE